MTAKQALFSVVVAGLLIWGFIEMRDPYRTPLPARRGDFASIQPQLTRLSPTDRDLVSGYLERSGGDVLPPAMADPENRLTARTIGEAIKLQRDFLAKQAVIDAQARVRKAARDETLAPLRAALGVELVKREILPRGEVLQKPGERGGAKVAIDEMQIMVTTYRLTNTSETTIESARASVKIRKARPEMGELGILSDCWIERHEPILPGEAVEFECGNINKHASDEDRAFVAMSETDFIMEWEPREIRFADGTELKFTE